MAAYSEDDLKADLNARGYRLTTQRQRILEIFRAIPQGKHLSAEDLHNTLTQSGERIGLSTVYRTLHLMVYMGMLRELELAEGHKHYELNRPLRERHHHLVCVYCNKTIEFSENQIDQVGKKQANSAGYYILDCQLTLYGICPECGDGSAS